MNLSLGAEPQRHRGTGRGAVPARPPWLGAGPAQRQRPAWDRLLPVLR